MGLFDFFWKRIIHIADTTAQSSVIDINDHLVEIKDRIRRIETKQKETSIQLEEIDGFLQNGGNETGFIDAIITITDIIYDFYFFSCREEESLLCEQARMMWNAAVNAAESAGLRIINAGSEPFDFRVHSTESTEQDCSLPNGYVTKTLKCGYIYNDEIIRRAVVIVNKIEKNNNDEPNIIYL